MPTERQIREAGPLSAGDGEVQDALATLSRAVQRAILRLEDHERRAALAQRPEKPPPPPEDEEHPPPEKARGAAPRPEGAAPTSFTSTTTPTGDQTDEEHLCYRPV